MSEICSKIYFGLHVKYPLFSSDFKETVIFSADFRIIHKNKNFMKIRPVADESFHADGRTDRHNEANSRFSQDLRRLLRTLGTKKKVNMSVPSPKKRAGGVEVSHYRPGYELSRWKGCQPYAPAAFTPRYSLLLGAESTTPGPYCRRKDQVNEKSH
jgi:hypothetical protein